MAVISVIVPVYKVEPYIYRCVDSILNQTFTDFELILVDDGSPDNCGAICDEYAKQDSRVVVIHQENGGLSAARNAGIDWAFANSDSEWITFVDSDDWVHPAYLGLLWNAVVECGVCISCCNMAEEAIDIYAPVVPRKYKTEDAYCCDELKFNSIPAWGKLYYKPLWNSIRFPVGKIHEDRFTTHKLLFQLSEVAHVNVPLYNYTVNAESITHREWNPKRLDDIDALDEQIAFFMSKNYYRAATRTKKSALYICCKMIEEIQVSRVMFGSGGNDHLEPNENNQFESIRNRQQPRLVLDFTVWVSQMRLAL